MQSILFLFSFIFGSIIGSFLNVVILRHNTGLTKRRSFCYSCGRTLSPRELIPIFSYLFQRGKCVSCKSRISSQYFIVEFITGLTSLFLFTDFYNNSFDEIGFLKYLLTFILFSLFICIFVYDIKHKIIPNTWTFISLILSIILSLVSGIDVKQILLGAFFVTLPLFLINFLTKGRAMGFGDVKFALVIGSLLGVSSGLSALIISFWIGGLVGIYLLLKYPKKVNRKTEIAFGPFLILATVLVFIFGIQIDTIISWFGLLF